MPKDLTPEQVLSIFGPDPEAPVEAAPVGSKQENSEVEPKQDDTPAEAKAEDTEPDAEEVVDHDLDKAWSALERDGWSKADLKRMSVDRIKELGAKRAKNHEDIDNAYKDLKSLKEAAKKAEKPKEPVLDRAAESQGDISDALKAFEAEFGPEGAKALKPLIDKLAALEDANKQSQQASAQAERTRIQKVFGEQYPEIQKPAIWDAMLVVAEQKSEEGMTSEDAVRAALLEMYGDRAAQPKSEPKKALRVRDTPEAPSRSGAAKPMARSERELKALELIENGAGLDEARKVLTN